LTREQRRVVGVLIEKSKTTPETYPMTVNAITTGCNQKNNRAPQMELEQADVENALHELRQFGAVTEVQGTGRVPKFRHNMYQWLGVDKVELAVMAELLLRGQQTVGELRGRAARMEPIADMHELKPVLDQLIAKRLVIELTPPGRGQFVSHNLYSERELQKVRELVAAGGAVEDGDGEAGAAAPEPIVKTHAGSDVKSQLQALQNLLDQVVRRIEQLEAKLG
jgi:uncharacterized protein YceH (UPF0502 family)